MILVIAGTSEGRQVIAHLNDAGCKVWATTVTAYGGELAAQAGAQQVLVGAVVPADWPGLLLRLQPEVVVDASHPHASQVTPAVRQACATTGISYIRYCRSLPPLPENPLIIGVDGWEEAVEQLAALPGIIFCAVGTTPLGMLVAAQQLAGRRFVARVLPQAAAINRCLEIGLRPGEIIAMQGPFSLELNLAIWRQWQVGVVVTKNSGDAGGLPAKAQAAMKMELPLVVVNPPQEQLDRRAMTIAEVLDRVQGGV